MAVSKLSENQVKTYQEILVEHGEDGLYRKAIGIGIMRYASNVKRPEVELLDLSDAFFIAHRRGGDEMLFTIGRVLRRSAHTLYRKLLKDNEERKANIRFLNVVR